MSCFWCLKYGFYVSGKFYNFFSTLGLGGSGHLYAPVTLVKRKLPPVPNGEEEGNK